jgi:CzcA family heavy metal efflux pump
MFTWIIGSSLKFRFVVLAIAAALLVFGTQQLRTMPVDVFPEFAPPKVEVQTEGPGMTANEVEELITIPMENQLRSVAGVEYVRSSSVTGLSQVVLLFKMGADLMDARQRVQERLKLAIAELPKSSGMPVMLQPLSSTSRVMKIGISSKVHNQMDLSMITYWTIKFRLMSVPGVANIPLWGDQIKSLQVQVDPSLMRAHNVTLDEVMETTSDALDIGMLTYSAGAKARIDGMIDTPNQRLVIHNESPVFSVDHLAQVPLALKSKRPDPPRIGDVGKVVWDTWPLIGDAVINDGNGLMMIVEKLPWANTLEVTRGVEEALASLKPGLPGVEIDSTIFRPATFIEQSMENLSLALIISCILVVIVLGAFLYEWRVALISVVAIPLSLVAAGVVLYFMDATINTMVLAGFIVALGDVVDDAIIDVENIMRRLRQHRKEGSEKSTARIILEASLEVRSAIVHATAIVVLAVTPVFFMGGLSGVFFEPLILTYLVAMLASMVVALTVTPAMCLIMLNNRKALEGRESPLVPWLKRHYKAALTRVIQAPRGAFATVIVLVIAAGGVWPYLGTSLLPAFKERDFLMHWVPAEGTSHPETFRITQAASRELRAIPGVRNFGAHIGRAVGGDEPYGVNFTENWISIDPNVDYDKARSDVEAAVAGYPGLYRDVQTYLKERIKEVLSGAGESIVIRIFGPDLPGLRAKAAELEEALKDIPGLIDLHAEQQVGVPQVVVKTKLDAAARYGIKPGDVRRVVNVLMSGLEVTDIHKDGKVYDVFVWTAPSVRQNVDDIREFLIDTPYGGRVRIAEVADVLLEPTPNKIKRENNSRRIDVHGNVKGRDLGSVAKDVEARLAKVQFPIGYYPQVLGEYKERQAAQRNLLIASLVVIAAIFLILHATFRNLRLATMIFLALPAALVGAVLATFAADRVISLGSLVGIITILGLSARNGIMLIEHCRHLEKKEGVTFGIDLVMRGASERLSPILMTTLCTALALLPLIVPGSIPGHEVEHPMAVAILGGIITSSLLSLFVMPILYLRYGAGSAGSRDGLPGDADVAPPGASATQLSPAL